MYCTVPHSAVTYCNVKFCLAAMTTPLRLVLLAAAVAAPAGATGGAFAPPSAVAEYANALSFCMKEGVAVSSETTTTLAELTQAPGRELHSRVVILANYYTGCTGGRQEVRAASSVTVVRRLTCGCSRKKKEKKSPGFFCCFSSRRTHSCHL